MPLPKTTARIPACARSFVILSCALFANFAMAARASSTSVPLGSVLDANRARLDAKSAFRGSSIYDGDRLETDDEGMLRVLLNEARVYLRPSTLIEVHTAQKGFRAILIHGTVVVSSPEGRSFQLLCDDNTIRPLSPAATAVQITRLSPNRLLLSSDRGGIQVSFDDDAKTVEAGTSYQITIGRDDSDPQDDSNRSRPVPPLRLRALRIVIPTSIVAGVMAWLALMSPTCP